MRSSLAPRRLRRCLSLIFSFIFSLCSWESVGAEPDPDSDPDPDPASAPERPPSGEARVHVVRRRIALVEQESPQLSVRLGTQGATLLEGGAAGHPRRLSFRGAGAHQHLLSLQGVQLAGDAGGGFDLSLLPLGLFSQLLLDGETGGATGGSGAQGGALRFELPQGPGRLLRLRLASESLAALEGRWAGEAHQLVGALQAGEGAAPLASGERRENNGHRRLFLAAQGADEERALSYLATVASLERGEPGPLKLSRPRARSEQRLFLTALRWRAAAPLGARLSLELQRRSFSYQDPDALGLGTLRESALTLDQLALRGSWGAQAGPLLQLRLSGEAAVALAQSTQLSAPATRERGALWGESEWWIWSRQLRFRAALRADARRGRALLWLPLLALDWHPLPRWRLALQGDRRFRDPSLEALYLEGPGLLPNPALPPEQGEALSAKIAYRRAHFQFTLSPFLQRFDQLLILEPIDAYRLQTRAREGAQIWGVSAYLWLRHRPLFVEASGTAQRHRSRAIPAPLPLTPEYFGLFTVGLRESATTLRLTTTARAPVSSDRFGLRSLPAWWRSDLVLSGRLPSAERRARDWRVSCALLDLFNRGGTDFIQRPLPGRRLWLSLSYQR